MGMGPIEICSYVCAVNVWREEERLMRDEGGMEGEKVGVGAREERGRLREGEGGKKEGEIEIEREIEREGGRERDRDR
jgi:hypothetical protein